jgi:hypothetical protein
MGRQLSISLLCLALTAPALAADQVSFAAAAAPEQAFEVCFRETAEAAAACALKACVDGGNSECAVVAACSPGWAGTIGIAFDEIHFTDVVCGAPSEAAAVTALKAFCKGHLPGVRDCYLASVWSPEGKEKQLEQQVNPKKIK